MAPALALGLRAGLQRGGSGLHRLTINMEVSGTVANHVTRATTPETCGRAASWQSTLLPFVPFLAFAFAFFFALSFGAFSPLGPPLRLTPRLESLPTGRPYHAKAPLRMDIEGVDAARRLDSERWEALNNRPESQRYDSWTPVWVPAGPNTAIDRLTRDNPRSASLSNNMQVNHRPAMEDLPEI